MASSHRSAITKFVKKHSPVGDTKYDIFDRGGPNGQPRLGRAQLRRNRTQRPELPGARRTKRIV